MKKVLVGMSGGVDSSVTAYLLKKEGYEVCGVTLRTLNSGDGSGNVSRAIEDAERVARQLGIRHCTLDCAADFSKKVVDPFVQSYLAGETPNPCIICNRCLKWAKMLDAAKAMGADYVATGHYARVVRLENGRYTVKKALHAAKDQTYMLYRLSQEQLAATLMPLGGFTKDEVRQIAEEAALPVAQKPDSQEICFVTDGHYADFIEAYVEGKNAEILSKSTPSPDENAEWRKLGTEGYSAEKTSCSAGVLLRVPGPGNYVDTEGRILGKHKGITHYTIGQRKGLGIALGRHVYVKEIRPATDEVVLSDEPALFSDTVLCRDTNFLSIEGMEPGGQIRARAKVRYHHTPVAAVIEMLPDGRVCIHFDSPVRAAAPGQSAVFYDDEDCVIGGGIIC